MRLLLDTHASLWFQSNDLQLSVAARTAILDPVNERWLSPISLLEIALTNRIGKLPLSAPFRALYPSSLIAATTLVEGLTLVSRDAVFDDYGLSRLW